MQQAVNLVLEGGEEFACSVPSATTWENKNIYISVPDEQKPKIAAAGLTILATLGTHEYLKQKKPTVQTAIAARDIRLMVSVPCTNDDADAVVGRRLAIDNHIPLVTNGEIDLILLRCPGERKLADVPIKPRQEYVEASYV